MTICITAMKNRHWIMWSDWCRNLGRFPSIGAGVETVKEMQGITYRGLI